MKKLFTIITLIVALAPALNAATPATIMVRPDSETAADYALLADMATVKSADQTLTKKLAGIQVCTSPLPGRTRVVCKSQIQIALRAAGVGDGSVELLCPTQVTLKRSASLVSGQAIFETAKAFVLSGQSESGIATVDTSKLPADQSIPTGRFELRVKAGTKSVRKGQCYIPVEIVINDRVYQTISVALTAKLIASVLVAKQTIARLGELTDANTAIEQRDVTNLPSDVLYERPAAGMTVTLPVTEGTVIRSSWVSTPVAVKSGDSVIVIVESGAVKVTEKGTAVQDGRVGQTIRVTFQNSNREVRAAVVEPGLVKITIAK